MTLVSTANLLEHSPPAGRALKLPCCAGTCDFNDDFDAVPGDADWADSPPDLDDLDSENEFDPEPLDEELLDDFEFDDDFEDIGPPPDDLWTEADWE